MSQRHLHRRTVLRGIGTGLALPLMDIMQPTKAAMAAGAVANAPVRMACLFFANGAIMDKWRPTGEGKDFELSQTLSPLAEVKDDLLVLEGLTHDMFK